MACDDSSDPKATFVKERDGEEIHDCTCPNLFYVAERDVRTGEFLPKKECSPCDATAYQGPDTRTVTDCKVCPVRGQLYDVTTDPYTCVCSSNSPYGDFKPAGDICILNSVILKGKGDYEAANTAITYSDVEAKNVEGEWTINTVGGPDSGTLEYFYTKAAVGCAQWNNPKDCQVLANLCVL